MTLLCAFGCQDLRLRVLGILQTLFPVLGHTSPATPLCMPPYWSTLGPSFCGAHTECILRLVRPVPRATTRLGTSLVGLLLGHLANDILLHTSLARELTITRNMRLSTRNTRLRDIGPCALLLFARCPGPVEPASSRMCLFLGAPPGLCLLLVTCRITTVARVVGQSVGLAVHRPSTGPFGGDDAQLVGAPRGDGARPLHIQQ